MRRLVPIAVLLPLLVFAAGCSTSKPYGGDTVSAKPTTVVGTLPKAETASVPEQYKNGDPTAGKAIFTGVGGCGGCHTLADAGTNGKVGPVLDQAKPSLSLAVKRVTQGQGAMPSFKGQLSDTQIANVTAYVVQASGGNANG